MVYAIWTHVFHLPGATTDQYSCETLSSKQQLLGAIIDVLEESRESLIVLGGEEIEEELDDLLTDLESEYEDPELEDRDLTNRIWEVGDMEITIHMAECYPKVLHFFKAALEEVSGEDFDSYAEVNIEEDEEFVDEDERLFHSISHINTNTPEEEFRDIFAACCERFGEWETF